MSSGLTSQDCVTCGRTSGVDVSFILKTTLTSKWPQNVDWVDSVRGETRMFKTN